MVKTATLERGRVFSSQSTKLRAKRASAFTCPFRKFHPVQIRLLGEHDVLERETLPLVSAYKDKIWFCPMNSGCTKPFPHARGKSTFQRISDYAYAAWRTKRSRGERVVELAVDYAVPNIEKFVKRVVRMKGNDEISLMFETQ